MHEEMWAGVELKVQNAEFHLQRMEQSLNLPEPTALYVALEASGAILALIGTGHSTRIWMRFCQRCGASPRLFNFASAKMIITS